MKRTTSLKLRMFSMMVALVASLFASTALAQTKLTVVGGSKVDGSGESCVQLVDGNFTSKWGQTFNASPSNPWIVVKADQPVVPTAYYLVTGNDTGGAPGRNWNTWKIYAGNFATDEEATRDAEGWVLVDDKVNYALPAANCKSVQLTFSEATTTAYTHFRIEVLAINSLDAGVYCQMSEFGLGSPDDVTTVQYLPVLGSKTGGEGADKLTDGNEGTKWGYSSSEIGWYIFRTTKAILPTYYHMVTGHDSGSWINRGWKDYSIYGGKFENDDAAIKDREDNFNSREFTTWKLIEQRTGMTSDVIPNKNCAHVYLDLLTPATEAYDYFLVIVDKNQGDQWCQMAEFSWGNPEIFLNTRNNLYETYSSYEMPVVYKPLAEEYAAALEELNTVDNPGAITPATAKLDEIKSRIQTCAAAYQSYIEVVESLIKDLAAGKVTDEAGLALLKAYVEEEIAPNATYPAGSYKYILANCQLDLAGIKEEAARLNEEIEKYVPTVPAIDVTYECLDGTAGFNGDEGPASLVDGNDDTKWCLGSGCPCYIVFMASEPIAPTYVRLFTSGDTGSYWDRNWKAWTLYAGNFESPEAALAATDDQWTVIDKKSDANLPAASNKAVYRNLSNPSETPYQYFKLIITESDGASTLQMSGFSFGNNGNFRESRNAYVEEFEAFLTDLGEDFVAQKSLLEEYAAALKTLRRCGTAADMGDIYNTLRSMQDEIIYSVQAYEYYMTMVEEYMDYVEYIENEKEAEIQALYVGEEPIAPCDMFPNGSYQYIIQNGNLDNDAIDKEAEKVQSYINAINNGTPVVLAGSGGHWGDGHYKQLVDGDNTTKWGGGIPEGGMYLIFKTMDAVAPFFYGLETGGDTEAYTGRNWKSWNIYAANFEYDGQATRDAEGWIQIDHKENIGQDRLLPKNNTISYFGFSGEIPEEGYRYYMVEVLAAYNGGAVQMQEMMFCTEDEFDEIRDLYVTELSEHLSEDLVADAALIAEYEGLVDQVENAEGIEDMFVTYYKAKDFWKTVETSAGVYLRYMTAVADLNEYLQNTPLDESDALETLTSYLEDEEEPSAEGFPNGSYNYIVENHLLTDSAVLVEIDYLIELKAAAVAKGYGPGADLTAMLKNPTFAKKNEGWLGDSVFVANSATYYTSSRRYYTGVESVNAKFNIYQNFSGLKNGLYMFELTGSFRAAGDYMNTNHAAKIYANENETYIQTGPEGYIPMEEAKDMSNVNISGSNSDKLYITEEGDTLGYILWAHNGAAIASIAGTYNNVVVVNVTDGNLTVGITNPNTATPDANDIERVLMSNARLTYLGEMNGEVAAEGIQKAVAHGVARANTLLAYEASVDADYASKPNFSNAEREALNAAIASADAAATAEDKYAVLGQFSNIFQSIYKTKFDYVALMDAEIDVYEKWGNEVSYMTDEEQVKFENYTFDVQTKWMEGSYSGEQALAMADELYATYPDYLALDVEKYAVAEGVIAQDAPFSYQVTLGTDTRFGLAGFYNDLNEDQTILTFEYKSAGDFVPTVYFANPSVLLSNSLVLEDNGAAEEWKRVYFNVEFARLGMFGGSATATDKWGTADHWLLWQLNGAGETVSIRNVQMVTRAEMDAAGGTVGITGVANDATLQQEGIYTLSGVRVDKATRGLYIKDGRKVIVK